MGVWLGNQQLLTGTVVRAFGKFFEVALDESDATLLCTPKGILKRERKGTDIVAVGDRVTVVDVGDGEGRIELVEPRQSVLARLARHTRDTEQVLVANPDQALFLFAATEPVPHPRMLDRFLVLAESRDLPVLIGVNKIDLLAGDPAQVFPEHRAIYPVIDISVRTDQGVNYLRELLEGKITVVAGPSGVGKSSLVNSLNPDLGLAISSISESTGKGKHTTTAAQLFRLGPETYIADTPGIRALALQGVALEDLPECFPEFRPFLGHCRFNDCTHVHEPGCAIREAVGSGEIGFGRYESYVSLRRGDPED
ncbi:MAG TPA: ribosome small subunit-dependent GTPase A [Thermomicrobiales bacterium]|nr:ribosome small subunit-dependent GTPase A [Thermomicrobiales bacterium]